MKSHKHNFKTWLIINEVLFCITLLQKFTTGISVTTVNQCFYNCKPNPDVDHF